MPGAGLRVEVAYALAGQQAVVPLEVEPGATLRDAIQRSGLLERFPEIRLGQGSVGVFGKLRGLDEALSAGDRVEIYRPLLTEPRERRRKAAKKKL